MIEQNLKHIPADVRASVSDFKREFLVGVDIKSIFQTIFNSLLRGK